MEHEAANQEVLNSMLIAYVVENASEMKSTLQELFLAHYVTEDETTLKTRDKTANHYQKMNDLLSYYESQIGINSDNT